MLTKHQQQDLEKAILGYFVSKKYYQTVSCLAQESTYLESSDFISLEESSEKSENPSQINLIFNISEDDTDFTLSKNTALTNLSVSLYKI